MDDQTAWYWMHHPLRHDNCADCSQPHVGCQCHDERHLCASLGHATGCEGDAMKGKMCAWCVRYHQAAAQQEDMSRRKNVEVMVAG